MRPLQVDEYKQFVQLLLAIKLLLNDQISLEQFAKLYLLTSVIRLGYYDAQLDPRIEHVQDQILDTILHIQPHRAKRSVILLLSRRPLILTDCAAVDTGVRLVSIVVDTVAMPIRFVLKLGTGAGVTCATEARQNHRLSPK